MNEILDFIVRHWQLSSLFIALLGVYIWFEFRDSTDSKLISAEHAIALYNHQGATILDIRPTQYFNEGHIIGSVAAEDDVQDTQLRRLQKYAQKPVVVVCADGKKSAMFAAKLRANGFAQTHSLAGGIKAWQDAGLPLIKK